MIGSGLKTQITTLDDVKIAWPTGEYKIPLKIQSILNRTVDSIEEQVKRKAFVHIQVATA